MMDVVACDNHIHHHNHFNLTNVKGDVSCGCVSLALLPVGASLNGIVTAQIVVVRVTDRCRAYLVPNHPSPSAQITSTGFFLMPRPIFAARSTHHPYSAH